MYNSAESIKIVQNYLNFLENLDENEWICVKRQTSFIMSGPHNPQVMTLKYK